MDERKEASVWYVASIGICVFVALLMITGLFSGGEVTAITAQ